MSDNDEKPAIFPDAQSWLSSSKMPGLKVYIEVEGEPATIYGRDIGQSKDGVSLVSGCIEGAPGRRFKICYWDQRASTKYAHAVDYYLEGKIVYQGTILKAVSYLKLPINSDERLVEYSELRIDEVRSISLVSSTDQAENATADEFVIRQVGSIDVCLSPLKSCRPRKPTDPDDWFEPIVPEASKALSETEKKAQFAVSTGVGEISDTTTAYEESFWVSERFDNVNPAVIYSFEVWSRAGLETKGLVEPLPAEVKPDRDESPAAAPHNAELAAIEAQILALQQRADALQGDDEKKVKAERPQAGSQGERDEGVIEKGGAIYIDFDEDEIE